MRKPFRGWLALLLAAFLLMSAQPGIAQGMQDGRWIRLRSYLDTKVEVTTASGEKRKGMLVAVADDSLTIEDKRGAHSIAYADVRVVRTTRSRSAILGWTLGLAAAGAGMGAIGGGVRNGLAEIPGRQAQDISAGAAIGGGVGAVAGLVTGIARSNRSVVLYRRTP